MPRHLRKRYPGAKYHVTNRGNGRQKLFYCEGDYLRFITQLSDALNCDDVVLYAYCLMPNHFHLFVETPRANIDRFMDRLGTAYAMYFRYKHYRPGHCFQGRYKAPLVEGDDYVTRLTRYIHLNPVCVEHASEWGVEEKWDYLKGYPWSSLHGYLSHSRKTDFVNYKWLNLFGSRNAASQRRSYGSYIRRQVGEEDAVLSDAFGRSTYAIGDEGFVAEVEAWVRKEATAAGNPQDTAVPSDSPSLEADPYECHNVAEEPEMEPVLESLRGALFEQEARLERRPLCEGRWGRKHMDRWSDFILNHVANSRPEFCAVPTEEE